MATLVYPALVTGDHAQGYHANLVDFEQLTPSAASPAELLTAARDLLLGALTRLEKAGRDWPAATPVEALGERAGGAIVMLVDVQVEDPPMRVNISIGERLLRRLDQTAEAQNMTRSGFIAAAVRQRLGDQASDETIGERASSQRLLDEVAEVGRRVNEALGPDSAFGRTLADLDARALDGLRLMAENVGAMVKRQGQNRRPAASSREDGADRSAGPS